MTQPRDTHSSDLRPDDDVAIRVSGLGKRYRIGQASGYKTLVETMSGWFRGGERDERPTGDADEFWALNDVNFEVRRGEVVGIIGRNGAGKSTLLKVLSRITEPTTGRVEITGRVGSLLEVGTGFHPELTGRENVFLNGAILGMREGEIRRKFDEIVAFAEIEQFIDTPVKRYSSGMYTRLAFAVAAHLEPEILIIDEVLAVGDAAFQKKCMGKMKNVAENGRTVLFVSHNASALARLCDSGVQLHRGRVVMTGPIHDVLAGYIKSDKGGIASRAWSPAEAPGGDVKLREGRIVDADGQTVDTVPTNCSVAVEMTFDVRRGGLVLYPNIHVFGEDGTCLFIAQDLDPAWRGRPRPVGTYISRAEIPPNLLAEGLTMVGLAVSTFVPMNVHFYERDAIAFNVTEPRKGESSRGDYHGHLPGAVRPMLDWSTRFEPLVVAATESADAGKV